VIDKIRRTGYFLLSHSHVDGLFKMKITSGENATYSNTAVVKMPNCHLGMTTSCPAVKSKYGLTGSDGWQLLRSSTRSHERRHALLVVSRATARLGANEVDEGSR